MRARKESETAHADIRVDKWLWAARFFKTRAVAADAISGGKVHCNGERCKPAKSIKPGDRLSIRKGIYEYAIDVLAVSRQRLPAERAQSLYRETDESIAARELRHAAMQVTNSQQAAPARRPNKRERRQLIAAKSRYSS
jgi:ribosome-associated heat shock protein Hsp15